VIEKVFGEINERGAVVLIGASCAAYRVQRDDFRRADISSLTFRERKVHVLILIIILVLVLGGGGGFYGHSRWGYGGGAGIGLGTILLILLVAYMLGVFH